MVDLSEACELFSLHELAVEDAAGAHERPKVESFDGFYLIVFKTARYDRHAKRVDFGEVDIFLGAGYGIAVRHGAPVTRSAPGSGSSIIRSC